MTKQTTNWNIKASATIVPFQQILDFHICIEINALETKIAFSISL